MSSQFPSSQRTTMGLVHSSPSFIVWKILFPTNLDSVLLFRVSQFPRTFRSLSNLSTLVPGIFTEYHTYLRSLVLVDGRTEERKSVERKPFPPNHVSLLIFVLPVLYNTYDRHISPWKGFHY